MNEKIKHLPVMVDEVVSFLKPEDKKTYLDCTFGQGGHSKKILSKARCNVFALDRDFESSFFAKKIEKEFPDNFSFKNEKFSNIWRILKREKIQKFDGLILDLGISNTQLNNPERGFSFSADGPLDMRMDKKNSLITAKQIINEFSEKQLSEIFFHYGEERNSRKIASSIIKYRKKTIIKTTFALSEIIKKINYYDKKHPATRVFQALRIYINDELRELDFLLNHFDKILNRKSRIVILSFHSLEDRIVKNFFKKNSNIKKKIVDQKESDFYNYYLKILTKKPVVASTKERITNNRSRSAKMRVAEVI
mgnify:FL=1